jgi:hypothetical protein
MEAEERQRTLEAFQKYGVHLDRFHGTDFEVFCHGLNLFLCICGRGVVIAETSTLGERIRLSELLIVALEDAGYKIGLRPHQLSGLDWKALRSVAEWSGHRAHVKREDAKQDAQRRYDELLANRRSRGRIQTSVPSRTGDEPIPETVPIRLDDFAISQLRKGLENQHAAIQASTMKLGEVSALGKDLRSRMDTVGDESLARLEEISVLVEKNERLKVAEKNFKATCRKQRDQLISLFQSLASETNAQEAELVELHQIHERINERLGRARVILAGLSRQQAADTRNEDEQPNSAELVQFERRFAELYEQMALKSDEHRRHVATYNASSARLRMLRDQVSLLSRFEMDSQPRSNRSQPQRILHPSCPTSWRASITVSNDRKRK